ncbi:hypothetical protein GCM10023092_19090 [Rurimicrobium arvi]|uniref:Secretion system C-terminal sorting domain-containing protein n=2 Tax=Rurimicrobium arvi TaxID=2049916 RepID=A0ABP8MWB2_9BACT
MVPDTSTHSAGSGAYIIPTVFNPLAIDTCGRFRVFYMDRQIALSGGPSDGFAHPTWGASRRNVMCQMLTYLQDRIDLSNISTGEYVRLYIDTSASPSIPAPSSLYSTLCLAAPFHWPAAKHDTVNGFVFDYITSGIDPNASGYHGYLKMNFDKAYVPTSPPDSLVYNNEMRNPGCNEFDLATVLEHNLLHVFGWFSWMDRLHTGTLDTLYSNYDTSLHGTPPPRLSTNPFGSLAPIYPAPSPGYGMIPWANGKMPPENYPVIESDWSHWDTQYYTSRMSPGEWYYYVMTYAFDRGNKRRALYKGEIEHLHTIGYNYNPVFALDSTAKIANHIPISAKMGSDTMNRLFWNWLWKTMPEEFFPPDYVITNDSGTSVTINLSGNPDFVDADSDTISIAEGSVVNIRGCSKGSNNHGCLVLSNANRTITYTPRHNFYGKAQFCFNLRDPLQEGGCVYYTIDVKKGNNVTLTADTNMVLNGDFEEGSEVRTTDSNNYLIRMSAGERGFIAHHYSDSHPFDFSAFWSGTAIRNSLDTCGSGYIGYVRWGSERISFPASVDLALGAKFIHPEAKGAIGNRYQPMADTLNIYLADTMRHCNRYKLEFDARRTLIPSAGTFAYPLYDQFCIGFWSDTMFSSNLVPYYSRPLAVFSSDKNRVDEWTHFAIPFTYCRDTTANVLALYIKGLYTSPPAQIIDNITLKPMSDPISFHILDSANGSCQRRLFPDLLETGCSGTSYAWRKLGDTTVISTSASLDISTKTATKYILTISGSCGGSYSDTFSATKLCPCSVGAVLGAAKDSVLPSSLSTTLLPGKYHLTSDLSITSSLTFDNAELLIEPGVKISVASTAVLTLDSSHLFVCPDTNKLWKGIDLLSSGSSSGRITVKSHSLIEDADTAIRAVNPRTPSSGYIVSIDSAVFNRNVVSLLMSGYTAVTTDTAYPVLVQNAAFVSRKFSKTGSTYPLSWPDYYSLRAPISNGSKPPFAVHNDYDPVYTKNTKSPVAGIMLRDVGTYSGGKYYGLRIGNVGGTSYDSVLANLFDNTSAGLYAERSNLDCWNSYFINMQYIETSATGGFPPPAKVYYRGCGIYAAATSTGQYRLSVIQPPTVNGNVSNKFFNCTTGVQTSDFYNTFINRCQMASSNTLSSNVSSTGVYVQNIARSYGRLDVSDNTIGNIPTAIFVSQNVPNANRSTSIERNKLSATNPWMGSGSTSGQYMQQGISVNGVYSTAALTPADTAVIKDNTLSGVYNGIEVKGMSLIRALVDNNTIGMKLSDTSKVQYGIYVGSTQKGTIQNNTLTGDGGTVSSKKARAVYAAMNTDLRVCANSTTNIGRGFDFALIRPQTGIRWYGNSMNNGIYGFVLGSDVGNLNPEIDFMILVPPLHYGAGLNTWSGYGAGAYNTYCENMRDTRLSKLYYRTGLGAEIPTTNGSTTTTPAYYTYTPGTSLMNTDYTSSCLGSSHFPSRYYPLSRLRSVGPSLAMLVLADSLGYGQDGKPTQWMAQLSLYEAGLIDPSLSDSFPTFATFMTQAAGSRFGWVTSVQQALANGDVETAADLISYQPSATGFIPIDTDVSISDYAEADTVVDNYAAYFNYYLSYLTGTFTDTTGLQLLALKCPSVDGAAVFMARTLLGIVNGVHVVYDDDGCNRSNASSYYRIGDNQEATGSTAYSLYPNPNGGSFSLVQSVPNAETVPVKVYNALGMVVYASNLTFNNGRSDIRLTNAIPGVYLVCIGNGQSTCLRFVVH